MDENGVVNFKKTRRSKKKKGLDQNSVSTASVVVEMDRIVERMTGLDIVSESVTIVATEAVDANGSLDAPPRKTAKVCSSQSTRRVFRTCSLLSVGCVYQRDEAFTTSHWSTTSLALRTVRTSTKMGPLFPQRSPNPSPQDSFLG